MNDFHTNSGQLLKLSCLFYCLTEPTGLSYMKLNYANLVLTSFLIKNASQRNMLVTFMYKTLKFYFNNTGYIYFPNYF